MASCLTNSQQKMQSSNYTDEFGSDSELEETDTPIVEEFGLSRGATCWVCNGYYGPNFNEPLCGTCHSFLHPANPSEEQEVVTMISDDDDEDSGNDEPPFTAADKEKQEREERANNVENQDPIEENEDEEEEEEEVIIDQGGNEMLVLRLPQPLAPPALPDYMKMLTTPQIVIASEKTIEELPVEVIISIFSYLDDISLWNVGEVCKRWRNIVEKYSSQSMWRKYLKERWPLFQSCVEIRNWFQMYSSLMSSCFCRTCLIHMALKSPPRPRENAIRMSRLRFEFRSLNVDASEGIEAVPLDKQNSHWQASILGPSGSPYEGGKYFLYIFVPESYPMLPPTVRFLTKILHPNVSRHGDVGIDIIQHNWSLALTVSKLLISVQSLLTDPFTEICMEPELGYMYEHNRARFEKLARCWTWKYAMFEVIPPTEAIRLKGLENTKYC